MSSSDIRLSRVAVPAIDKILGHSFRVLDDGFIRVIDYMGSDESIVQAARISYGTGTRRINQDNGLIRYLMRHFHTTPFEMCEIKFHVRVPMDCWRQWIRHRTANVNEYSTRYSVAIDAAQRTASNQWRTQSAGNKQGSGDLIVEEVGIHLSEQEANLLAHIDDVYKERIQLGVAREQARKDLSLSTYTEAYWKIDLHNLFHFLELRMDSHAQDEIRSYANVIGGQIVSKWCPLAWEAFRDYRLNVTRLSSVEAAVLGLIVNGKIDDAKSYLKSLNLLASEENKMSKSREVAEMEEKLRKLGIEIDGMFP